MEDRNSLTMFLTGFSLVIAGVIGMSIVSNELKIPHDIEGFSIFSWLIIFVGGFLAGLGAMRDQMIRDYNLAPKIDKKAGN